MGLMWYCHPFHHGNPEQIGIYTNILEPIYLFPIDGLMIIFQYGGIIQAFDHATSEVWGIEPLQSLRSYDLLPQSSPVSSHSRQVCLLSPRRIRWKPVSSIGESLVFCRVNANCIGKWLESLEKSPIDLDSNSWPRNNSWNLKPGSLL